MDECLAVCSLRSHDLLLGQLKGRGGGCKIYSLGEMEPRKISFTKNLKEKC